MYSRVLFTSLSCSTFYLIHHQVAVAAGRRVDMGSDCYGVTLQTCVIRDLGVSAVNYLLYKVNYTVSNYTKGTTLFSKSMKLMLPFKQFIFNVIFLIILYVFLVGHWFRAHGCSGPVNIETGNWLLYISFHFFLLLFSYI